MRMRRPERRGAAAEFINPADVAFAACRGTFCVVSDGEPALRPDERYGPPAAAGVAVVDWTGRWGYTTDRGECLFPIQYERTLETLVNYAGIRVNPRRCFLDVRGAPYPLLSPATVPEGRRTYLTAHRGDDAWELRTHDGATVTRFHDVQAYFHQGRALLETGRGWCYVDPSGRRVWAPPSGQAGPYRGGRACFLERQNWGYADLTGRVAIEPQFDSAWNFSEGLAAVESGGRWFYINEAGDAANGARLSDARDFSAGLGRASPDGAFAISAAPPGRRLELRGCYGFLDWSGCFAIPPVYRAAQDFSEGLAAVMFGMKWGYVDRSGKVAIPAHYSWVSSFHDGLACVRRGRYYGYISRAAEVVVGFRYSKAFDYSEGLAAVQTEGAWGFIDVSGAWVIPPAHEDLSPFRGGLARAAVSGKFGYIDRGGRWVIPPHYDSATSFSEGLALVQRGQTRSCIDPKGNTAFVISRRGGPGAAGCP